MKRVFLIFGMAILLFSNITKAELNKRDCHEFYSISGTVKTKNISAILQVGKTHLMVADSAGEKVFDHDGAIIGRLVELDKTFGRALLNHHMVFSDGSQIQTRGDQGQVIGVCQDGRFKVKEVVTNVVLGTHFFEQAYIPASGINVSGCFSTKVDGHNIFKLSGQICLR